MEGVFEELLPQQLQLACNRGLLHLVERQDQLFEEDTSNRRLGRRRVSGRLRSFQLLQEAPGLLLSVVSIWFCKRKISLECVEIWSSVVSGNECYSYVYME